MWFALVRPPTAALARCELAFLERVPIDPQRALGEHAAYVALLERLGARSIVLPPEPGLPDAVFVEDTAVVLDEVAVVTRPGALSRRGEVATVAEALRPHRALVTIEPPATLDGGDVLVAERRVWVGRSARTNDAGHAQLARALAPFGYDVGVAQVRDCLHLKSAVSYLGRGAFLLNPRWVDVGLFEGARVLAVPDDEPFGANTAVVGETIVVASSHPGTAERVRAAGFAVAPVALDELMKAEAGPSCVSLRFRDPWAPNRAR
jgi:dimethylargininase